MLKLEYFPESKVLLQTAEPVEKFDSDLADFCAEMIDCMYLNAGVGLAAPQVGVSKRIFVISSKHVDTVAYINPTISYHTGQLDLAEEGCLSIPQVRALVPRFKRINLDYYTIDGTHCNIDLQGFSARIAQHEFDHLNGWLFPFYLIPGTKKGFYKPPIYTWQDDLKLEAFNV